ncbi:MAG: M28 family peptidase, partial [Cyclobacteriaceae bacterium]|nr:M28 family peptidase [Cyclobacteriaceae bacterium]
VVACAPHKIEKRLLCTLRYCWIWWVQKGHNFIAKKYRCNLRQRQSKKFGTERQNLDIQIVKQNVAGITDDHVFVNQVAKIPMINLVHYKAGIGFFGDYHHTAKDNLDIISKETLAAVGNALLNVLYYEN